MSLRFDRFVPADGPIDFLELPFPYHRVQSSQSLAGLGKKQDTAHRTVQTVRHAKEYIARLGIPLLDKCLELLAQRHIPGLVALHNLSRQLVDRQKMVVFIQYGSWGLHQYCSFSFGKQEAFTSST